MITLAKAGIGIFLAALLAVQLWVVPEVAAGFAQLAPEFAGLRMPGVVLNGILLLCVQLALLCAWRLLARFGAGRLFEDGAFRWVDAMIGLTVAGMAVVAAGCGVIGAAGAGSPFVLILTFLALAAGAAIALLLGALREVLRQAVLLQDQVVGVTHAQENPPR